MVKLNEAHYNSRKTIRMADNQNVFWSVRGSDEKGRGRIRNISTSGMSFESNYALNADHVTYLSLDTELGLDNYIPQLARLVWSEPIGLVRHKYMNGVEFINTEKDVSDKLIRTLHNKIEIYDRKKQSFPFVNGLLLVTIVFLSFYVVWLAQSSYQHLEESLNKLKFSHQQQVGLTQHYEQKYTYESKKLTYITSLYQVSEETLANVSVDLERTQAMLSETDVLLTQARQERDGLQDKYALLQRESKDELSVSNKKFLNSINELNTMIASLEGKNKVLSKEVIGLQEQLAFYSGDIKNIADGERLVALYRERLNDVTSKIKDFRKEANVLRRVALQKRDQFRLEIGNNGYFVKDGELIQVDQEKFDAATINEFHNAETAKSKYTVEVEFVEK